MNFAQRSTGSGYKFNADSQSPVVVSSLNNTEGTIELWVKFDEISPSNVLLSIENSDNYRACTLYFNASKQMQLNLYSDTTGTVYQVGISSVLNLVGYHHVRATYKVNTGIKIFIDGVQSGTTVAYTVTSLSFVKVVLGAFKSPGSNTVWQSPSTYSLKATISDVSISNIDRGSTFATLPQDFISGDAWITPGFTKQRKILSQAQMSQCVIGKAGIGSSSKGIVSSRNSGSWVENDTVVVTGFAGELISGVFDANTALATVNKDALATATDIYLDIVTTDLFSAADTLKFVDRITGNVLASGTIATSGVDVTNKKITLTGQIGVAVSMYRVIVMETTASSSVPKVSFGKEETAQAGTTSQITLAASASASDDFYNGLNIYIKSGTGAGQKSTITDYTGETKVALATWVTAPSSDSVYAIYGIPVAGAWTNLGTNAATFTLGTNALLTSETLEFH